jgi:hypothetical protein
MSRSGYSDDYDEAFSNAGWLWMRTVENAINGKQGQTFLREMLEALEAMPKKRLISGELEDASGEVCALGCVGKKRGIDMRNLDPEESEAIAEAFKIPRALVCEIEYQNDDGNHGATPEGRYGGMVRWIKRQLNGGR